MAQPPERRTEGEASIIDLRDELVDLQERLAASESRFEQVVDRSADGVLVVDADGIVRYANSAAAAMLGRRSDELVGREVGFPVMADEPIEVELIRPSEDITFAEMRVIDGEWEGRSCRIVFLWDVTERHHAEFELARRATHDHLTGLPNRFLLEDRLGHALARLGREAIPVAVFVVDVDDFKAINDRYGHLAGDAVLVTAARRLEAVLRPSDTAARVGGDEFVLACESMDRTSAKRLADRLVAAFAEPVTMTGEAAHPVGISVGFALAEDPTADPSAVIDAADRAMYRQKRRKRERQQEIGPA